MERISNVKVKTLEAIHFYRNDFFKQFGVSSGSSTLVPMYVDLMRSVIGEKVDETCQDLELSATETESIKAIFEGKIDETLPSRETQRPYDRKFVWREKEYRLNLSIPSPNNDCIWI